MNDNFTKETLQKYHHTNHKRKGTIKDIKLNNKKQSSKTVETVLELTQEEL